MEKIKHYTLRIDGNVLEKFHYVSKYDGRSVNAQLLIYIRKSILDFEKEHGTIEIQVPEQSDTLKSTILQTQ